MAILLRGSRVMKTCTTMNAGVLQSIIDQAERRHEPYRLYATDHSGDDSYYCVRIEVTANDERANGSGTSSH